jgi:hypothetical protein
MQPQRSLHMLATVRLLASRWRPEDTLQTVLSAGVLALLMFFLPPASWAGFIYQAADQALSTTSSPTFAGISVGTGPITFNDATLVNDGTNILAQKNGANAQVFRLYNTAPGANDEFLEFNWQATANKAVIRTGLAASGTARELALRYSNSTIDAITIGTNTAPTLGVDISYVANLGTASTKPILRVGNSLNMQATTGTQIVLGVNPSAGPLVTSTMVFRPLSITPTINYSNATPGAGNYDAIFVNVTETALPTGPNTLLKLQTGGTDRLVVSNAGAVISASTIKSTAATDLGWIVQNATNQACNTTCTTGACVFGFNTAALGNLVSCTDVTADSCLCSG